MSFLRRHRDVFSAIVVLTLVSSLLQPVGVFAGSEEPAKDWIEAEAYETERWIGTEENGPEAESESGEAVPEVKSESEGTEPEVKSESEGAQPKVQHEPDIAETEAAAGTENTETKTKSESEESERTAGEQMETMVPGTDTQTEAADMELSAADILEETAEEECVGASPYQYVTVDGGISVTGYTGTAVKLTIPSAIDGKTVVSVGKEAFREAEITSITLPSTLKNLGTRCFYRCEDLQSVNMSACTNLGTIGEGAFALCGLLSSVAIPDSVTVIEDDAFFSCGSLKTATIGSGVGKIGSYAFALCGSLESISLPAGVKTVDTSAFEHCEKMSGLSMSGVTEIGNNAFAFAEISSVKIPASCKKIGTGAFHDCDTLSGVTLQEGLTTVGRTAFANCPKLLTATVPESVTEIGDAAFGCSWGWDQTAEHIRPNTAFRIKAYKAGGAAEKYASRYGMSFTRITKTVSNAVISGIKKMYNYTGSALKPAPTVKDGAVTLKAGTDYSVAYSGNTEPGTATITVKGIGNYSGKLTKTFTVAPYPIYGARITATTGSSTYDYTGYARKPGVTVKFNGKKLTAGTDYTLSYSSNINPGTAKITVTGKGRFRLTREVTFKLALAVPSVTSAVKQSAGTMKITWQKYSNARGYQVRIARGTNEKKYTLPGAGTLTKTISGLQTNQTWRVYVRSYRKIDEKYYYSAWSPVIYVKV